jgi:Cu(I)/Ag(I) efflux system periplasmic protein CusF
MLKTTLFASLLALLMMPAPVAASTPAPAALSEGEVKKIDSGQSKITLKHGEIKNLDMPPMTMVFKVKDPTLLGKVKVGDKVRFVAEKQSEGYVVTLIEAGS